MSTAALRGSSETSTLQPQNDVLCFRRSEETHKSEKSTTAKALWKRLGNCRGTTIFHRVSSESLLPRSEGSGLERAGVRGGRGLDSWQGCLPAEAPAASSRTSLPQEYPPPLLRFPGGLCVSCHLLPLPSWPLGSTSPRLRRLSWMRTILPPPGHMHPSFSNPLRQLQGTSLIWEAL